MSDNVAISPGVGATVATDDVGGVQYQRIKVAHGADGSATDTSTAAPFPVTLANTGANATAVKVDGSGATQPVSIASAVPVTDNSGSLTVDGSVTVTQATGSNLHAVVDSGTITTVTNVVHVDDNTASLTVDAPVATPVFVRLSDGASAIATLPVSLATAPSTAVTNAGTFVVQENGSALTALQLIDDGVYTDDTSTHSTGTSKGYGIMAVATPTDANVDANDIGMVSMTTSRLLKVDASGVAVPITDNSGSLTVDYATTGSGNATGALRVELANNGTGVLATLGTITNVVHVDDNAGSLTVDYATTGSGNATGALRVELANNGTGLVGLNAGTNGIGKLTANAGVTIGAVELAAAQTLATVTTVSTVTTCSTLSGGGVAHDGVDSGNPVKVGARAALTLSDDTIVANADRTDLVSDGDGALITRDQFPLADLVSERVTDTGGTSTAFSNFTTGANTRNIVTAIAVYNSSATAGTVDFRDGTAGAVLWTMPIPAGGGSVMGGTLPLFKTTANTALAYDVSGALTTVTISISGFRSKVV